MFPSNLLKVYDFLSSKTDSFPNQPWYEMTLDLIESRTYNTAASKTTGSKPKTLIKLDFLNKGMDMINITNIINDKNVKKNLTAQFNKTEQNSTVYRLTKTIRSKIFTYKKSIKILATKDILDNMNNLSFTCTASPFTDPNHEHMACGNWRQTYFPQQHIKKLLCKGPKYREPVSINFSNCKIESKSSLKKFLLIGAKI